MDGLGIQGIRGAVPVLALATGQIMLHWALVAGPGDKEIGTELGRVRIGRYRHGRNLPEAPGSLIPSLG